MKQNITYYVWVLDHNSAKDMFSLKQVYFIADHKLGSSVLRK